MTVVPVEAPCCRIVLEHVVDLGQVDGPGAISRPAAVATDSRGRFYVVSEESPFEIVVFDGQGRFLRTIGRRGGGPGEFTSIGALRATRGDTLLVFDIRAARFTVLGPDGRFVRTFPFTGNLTQFEELPDGDIVAAGLAGQDTTSAPLHLVAASGAITTSFGGEYRRGDERAYYGAQRAIAPSADGAVWAAHVLQYRIERWRGQRLERVLLRQADWFPPRNVPGPTTPERAPDPQIRAIQEDANGYLWVLTTIGEPGWSSGLGDQPIRTPEGAFHPVEDLDQVFGTRIDILDPLSSTVVAELESPEFLIDFLAPGRAVSYRESAAGFPQLVVWDIKLESLEETAPAGPGWRVMVPAAVGLLLMGAFAARRLRRERTGVV